MTQTLTIADPIYVAGFGVDQARPDDVKGDLAIGILGGIQSAEGEMPVDLFLIAAPEAVHEMVERSIQALAKVGKLNRRAIMNAVRAGES